MNIFYTIKYTLKVALNGFTLFTPVMNRSLSLVIQGIFFYILTPKLFRIHLFSYFLSPEIFMLKELAKTY